MHVYRNILLGLAATTLLFLGVVAPAAAQPDVTAMSTISDSVGFPGVCTAPCFSLDKTVDVYFDGNATAPGGACPAGNNKYIYSLTHTGGSLPSPGIPITEFEVAVDFSLVTSAGFVPGAGIAPTSTTVSPLNVVAWSFPDSASCPGCLDEGLTSEDLFICSPAGPGSSPDNVSTTAVVLDAPGECLVPTDVEVCDITVDKFCEVIEPDDGDKDKDKDLDGIVDDAVELCEGKVKSLKLEYTGLGCAATNKDQNGKVTCKPDPGAQGDQPVDILVTNGKMTRTYANVAGASVGDVVDVSPSGAPKDKRLRGTLKVQIFEAGTATLIEKTRFKAKCNDDPDIGIAPGDQYGSSLVTELTSTKGGVVTLQDVTPDTSPTNLCSIPLPKDPGDHGKDKDKDVNGPNPGADVKYTYVITNVGTVDATNVTVEDDVLGTITGSPIASIPAGESVMLMQTQFITDDTTNTVVVDGDPQGDGECTATADATVEVEQPEDVPDKDKDKDKDKDNH